MRSSFSSSCVLRTQTWNALFVASVKSGSAGAGYVLFPARSGSEAPLALRMVDLHSCADSPPVWGIYQQRNRSMN